MAIRIFEVKAAPTTAGVDVPVRVVVRAAAIGNSLGFYAAEDPLQLLFAHMKGVVMAVVPPRVEAYTAPRLRLVGKIEGQVLVDLHLREVAIPRLHRQAEDLGKELGRGSLVLGGHDGVIE